jgi:fused signal recognition particle receptor
MTAVIIIVALVAVAIVAVLALRRRARTTTRGDNAPASSQLATGGATGRTVPEPPAPGEPSVARPPDPVVVSRGESPVAGDRPTEEAPDGGVEEIGELDPGSGELPEQPKAPVLRERLSRAVALLGAPLSALRGRGRIDASSFDELEEALLLADVGLPTTTRLLEPLRQQVRSRELEGDPALLLEALKQQVVALFHDEDRTLSRRGSTPVVWLFVGVNGVGKTTTIGKIAAREHGAGHKVVLAAGDTFRAAAGEQLDLWAQRSGAEIVRGADGADPSSVVFDAIQHAAAIGAPLVLADTAGRLHTKTNLMEELKKIRRVADRPPGNVEEVLLVLDATTGQNGLAQAREFASAVGVTGIVLTKLDGTAKGGIVLAVRAELGLPIKLVGLGEGAGDLVEFDPEEFAAALFD